MLGFRVWDSENKIFLTDTLHLCSVNYQGEMLNGNEYGKVYIPMQSTGLKDFKNKDIFEGDVLFIYIDNLLLSNHYYFVKSVNEFLIMYGRLGDYIHKISNDGNIYEQPALLERLK